MQKRWLSGRCTTIVILVTIGRILDVSFRFAIENARIGGDVENFGLFEWTLEHESLNIAGIEQAVSVVRFIAGIDNVWLG